MPARRLPGVRGRMTALETNNRPDEWRIEQGLQGAKLPIIDQTGTETIFIHPVDPPEITKDQAAIDAVGDRKKLFAAEQKGWKGYVRSYIYIYF
jgi:sulfite oxidase